MKLEEISDIDQFKCADNKYRYIYRILNTKEHTYYYGQHTTSDINDGYMGSGNKIKEYYQLSGYLNIEKEYIEFAKDQNDLNHKEYEIIMEHKTDPLCLNIADGGYGGWSSINRHYTKEERRNAGKKGWENMPDEIKLKVKNTYKIWRENATDEEFKQYKENISNGLRRYFKEHDSWWNGRKHSEESRKKQSESAKKIDRFGNKNPNYGNVWITNPSTNENRLIRKSDVIPDGWIKGRYQTMTSEQIEKLRNAVIGFKWINNGKINKQIKNGQDIPDGFKPGRISHGVPQKQLDYIKRHKEELKNVNYEKYKPMYEVFINYGFEEVKRKFNYTYTKENLVQQFKKYIPDFIPQPGKKRIPLK